VVCLLLEGRRGARSATSLRAGFARATETSLAPSGAGGAKAGGGRGTSTQQDDCRRNLGRTLVTAANASWGDERDERGTSSLRRTRHLGTAALRQRATNASSRHCDERVNSAHRHCVNGRRTRHLVAAANASRGDEHVTSSLRRTRQGETNTSHRRCVKGRRTRHLVTTAKGEERVTLSRRRRATNASPCHGGKRDAFERGISSLRQRRQRRRTRHLVAAAKTSLRQQATNTSHRRCVKGRRTHHIVTASKGDGRGTSSLRRTRRTRRTRHLGTAANESLQ
jgi:hypothetical protein